VIVCAIFLYSATLALMHAFIAGKIKSVGICSSFLAAEPTTS